MSTYTENTMTDTSTVNTECIYNDLKKSFMHSLCTEINHHESMHLKQYFQDDNDAVTMIFATKNSKQYRPSFCHICGDYMS